MKRSLFRAGLLIAAISVAGCRETVSPALSEPSEPAFGKGNVDTRPRANIVWTDVPHGFAPGIEGDSRSKDGSTSGVLDEYQGKYCGVAARIFTLSGESGNLDADFDTYYTSDMLDACGRSRHLVFHMGDPLGDVVFAPHFIVRGLAHLRVGETRSQWMGFGIQQTNCARVMFDAQYPGVNDARLTRLDDGSTAVRRWRVESQGSHKGQCVLADRKGTLYAVGEPVFLPFSFEVTEVPYPYPTYP